MAPDPGWLCGWTDRAPSRADGAGIEVILDVVLNHSGEGTLRPDIVAARLDNATITVAAGAPWRYANDTGCATRWHSTGPRRFVSRWIRYASGLAAGVHGFRSTRDNSGRRDGSLIQRAVAVAIAQDPVLRALN